MKPGVFELIDWLDGRGIARAVATSTRRDRAHSKLDAHRAVAALRGAGGRRRGRARQAGARHLPRGGAPARRSAAALRRARGFRARRARRAGRGHAADHGARPAAADGRAARTSTSSCTRRCTTSPRHSRAWKRRAGRQVAEGGSGRSRWPVRVELPVGHAAARQLGNRVCRAAAPRAGARRPRARCCDARQTLGGMTSYLVGRLFPRPQQSRALAWLTRYGPAALLLSWVPVIGDGAVRRVGMAAPERRSPRRCSSPSASSRATGRWPRDCRGGGPEAHAIIALWSQIRNIRETPHPHDRPPLRRSARKESAATPARRAGVAYEVDVPMSTFYNLPGDRRAHHAVHAPRRARGRAPALRLRLRERALARSGS